MIRVVIICLLLFFVNFDHNCAYSMIFLVTFYGKPAFRSVYDLQSLVNITDPQT